MRFAFTIAYTYVAIDCSITKKYICEIYLTEILATPV